MHGAEDQSLERRVARGQGVVQHIWVQIRKLSVRPGDQSLATWNDHTGSWAASRPPGDGVRKAQPTSSIPHHEPPSASPRTEIFVDQPQIPATKASTVRRR